MNNITKKQKRYVELAARVASQSTYGKIKHGAVLVKGGNVINAAFNKENFCSFGKRFRNPNAGTATLHAELGTVLGLDRSVTRGCTVYVVRVNRRGEYRMSKPCDMCEAALRHCGISKVFYSTNEEELEQMKL